MDLILNDSQSQPLLFALPKSIGHTYWQTTDSPQVKHETCTLRLCQSQNWVPRVPSDSPLLLWAGILRGLYSSLPKGEKDIRQDRMIKRVFSLVNSESKRVYPMQNGLISSKSRSSWKTKSLLYWLTCINKGPSLSLSSMYLNKTALKMMINTRKVLRKRRPLPSNDIYIHIFT